MAKLTTLKILKATAKPFTGSDGTEVNYNWYRAERINDGVTIEFGSRKSYDVDEEVEIELEKTELTNGKFRYKEPSSLSTEE